MTAKEYLQQAYTIDRRIGLDIQKLEAARSSLHGRAVNYRSDGTRSGSRENRIENAIIRVLEYEEKIGAEIDELTEKRQEIEKVINSVPDDVQREILTRRYLLYQKWELVAEEMHRDLRWIYRLHGKAVENLTIESH